MDAVAFLGLEPTHNRFVVDTHRRWPICPGVVKTGRMTSVVSSLRARGNADIAPRVEASQTERAVLASLVTVVAAGLAIDTRRHRTDRGLDTFFTSAHAVLYAGWLSCAVYLLFVVRKRLNTGAHGIEAVPVGFGGAVVGAALFGVGGVGDLLWHTVFGIERDLKILFSPTHLFLMSAMLLLCFGAVRSTWMSDESATLRVLWPAVLSTGALCSVLVVFFQYVSPFDRAVFTTQVPALLGLDQVVRSQSIVGVIVTTALLFGPILVLLRRWALPFGSCTIVLGVVMASNFVFTDFKPVRITVAVMVGSVAIDLLLSALRRFASPRIVFRLFGALAPLTLWATYVAVTVAQRRITWSAEEWTGTLVWSSLVGLAMTVLLLPPRNAPMSYLD